MTGLPQPLCHGALSRETAGLIDDGKGDEVSAEEWESKGKTTDFAVFKECSVLRADPDNDYPRGVYKLLIEDTPSAPYNKKGSVPLGPGFTGWALPDQAEVTLPAGCAARMGSTSPYITAPLEVPSQEEERLARLKEKRIVDPDTATRNNATVMREVATKASQAVQLRRLTMPRPPSPPPRCGGAGRRAGRTDAQGRRPSGRRPRCCLGGGPVAAPPAR